MKDFHDEDKEYWDDTYAKYWQDRVKESEDENSESLVLKYLYNNKRLNQTWKYNFPNLLFFHEICDL